MARIFKPSRTGVGSPKNREVTPTNLVITDFSSDGRGIARHQNKTVFVSGALPGETIEVIHYRRHKRFSECQTKSVLTPCTQRIKPQCKHFGACGGCELQYLNAEHQLTYKQNALLSMLERQQKITPQSVLPAIKSTAYGYRTRARFGITRTNQLAFREGGNDELVPIETCPVLVEPLLKLLEPLNQWLSTLPSRSGVTHIEINNAEPLPAIVVRHIKPLSQKAINHLKTLNNTAVCWLQSEKNGLLRDLDGNIAALNLNYPLADYGLQFAFQPGDFTQVNQQVNAAMVKQALEWLALEKSDHVADLFCGIGNFTLPIARFSGRIFGIEADQQMVVRGERNAALNNIDNVQFIALDLNTQALTRFLDREQCQKVLLDPPRSGARFVCEQIADSAVQRVVYVSCNPASFSRDSRILVDSGFEMTALRVLDMFPQTVHLETMALFVRTK